MSFKVLGLDVEVTNSSLIGSVVLFIVFMGIALALVSLSPLEAVVWSLIAVLLYWVSEFLHQYGHYLAGRRAGYPLTGMRLWTIFSASIYPKDEPTLPPTVHIQRALGGAPMSMAVGFVIGIVALLLKDSVSPFVLGLLVLLTFVNFAWFGLGAFLPLGFTDGSTLLHYWNKS